MSKRAAPNACPSHRRLGIIEPLERRTLLSAEFVKDLNTDSPGTSPYSPVYVPGLDTTFFGMDNDLWRTDGTVATSRVVKADFQNNSNPYLRNMTSLGDEVIFTDYFDLWRSDGTAAGTTRLTNTGFDYSNFAIFSDGQVAYAFRFGQQSVELSKTDGTAAGTTTMPWTNALLKSWAANQINVKDAAMLGGNLLFVVKNAAQNREELWRTDGTEAGTAMVKVVSIGGYDDSNTSHIVTAGDGVYFQAYSGKSPAGPAVHKLYRSDGTADGTVALCDLDFRAGSFCALGNALYFSNRSSTAAGYELWRSDGTPAGTGQVKDLAPISGRSSSPTALTAIGDRLYFTADSNNLADHEFWQSDGTAAGTVLLKIVAPVDTYSTTGPFLGDAANNVFFYCSGRLFHSDGTAGGSIEITGAPASPDLLAIVHGRLLYSWGVNPRGTEFWWSDGTPAGTAAMDLSPTNDDSNPSAFLSFAGATDFVTARYDLGGRLWRSDGTAGGTNLIDTGSVLVASGGAVRAGNLLLFAGRANSMNFRAELYRTDGTAAGTTLVKAINPTGSSNPLYLTELNGVAIFVATGADQVGRMWRSDGTATGTYQLPSDVVAYSANVSVAGTPVRAGNTAYFNATNFDGTYVLSELWRTDGTTASVIRQPGTGARSWDATPLAAAGDKLYMLVGRQPEYDARLWATDGTDAGTHVVRDDLVVTNYQMKPVAIGDTLYFRASGPEGYGLWRTDGTAAGTSLVVRIATGEQIYPVGTINGRLLYVLQRTSGLTELRSTDGTASGTATLPAPGSFYTKATAFAGRLFFTETDAAHGTELWSTDGTPNGTQVEDLIPGPDSSNPTQLWSNGSVMYFAAIKPGLGNELWRVTDTYAPTSYGATFDPRTNVQAFRVSFSEDVSASLPPSIELTNADIGTTARTIVRTGYDATTNTATYGSRPGNPPLPDGNYRVTLPSAGIKDAAGNALVGADVTLDFFILPGDADGDRAVGPADFNLLASHFGQSGQTLATGDFDGDGMVGPGDFNLLASRFGKSLSKPAAAQAALTLNTRALVSATPTVTRRAARKPHVPNALLR